MAEASDGEYDNTNRAFLQAFLARSTLTFEEAKAIIASILSVHGRPSLIFSQSWTISMLTITLEKREYLVEDVTEADFNNFIATANHAISSFDLEIRSTFHQLTRKRVYALINSTSDDLTQLATIHTPDEISFLKRVLDSMFETHNTPQYEIMAITSMQAIALAKAPSEAARRETQNGTETQGSTGQGLTMMQAEKMLKSLVDEGWFEKSRKGYYSLSPRALMELRGWLSATYNDVDDEDEGGDGRRIKTCLGCKEIITTVSTGDRWNLRVLTSLQGQRCARRECQCRLHDICTQQFFRSQDVRLCPWCKTGWTGNDFVGERAAAGMKEKPKRRQRSGINDGGSFARQHSPADVQENGDEPEVSDVDVEHED